MKTSVHHARAGVIGLASVVLSTITPGAFGEVASFAYPNFSDSSTLVFNGVAGSDGTALRVTQSVMGNQAGSVWYNTLVPIRDSFTAEFAFRVRDIAGFGGADGLAFVIQTQGLAALGDAGAGLGYATNPSFPVRGGITGSLAVEIDLWDNSAGFPDYNSDNHISIQTGGHGANQASQHHALGGGVAPGNMSDGFEHVVRVEYQRGDWMKVYLDNAPTPIATALGLDLGVLLPLDRSRAFVGFTASTGGPAAAQRHEVTSWSFTGVPTPTTAVVMLAFGGVMRARRRGRH